MATDFLNLRSGVGPGEDNLDDDVKQVQTALNETGFKPIGRDFGAFEVPETETRFFQNDTGLKDDGVIRPGGPTEQTMKKELAEKRERDVRTLGGFRTDADIRDPVGAGMFGPNMKVIGNKRRDVLAAKDAV